MQIKMHNQFQGSVDKTSQYPGSFYVTSHLANNE